MALFSGTVLTGPNGCLWGGCPGRNARIGGIIRAKGEVSSGFRRAGA